MFLSRHVKFRFFSFACLAVLNCSVHADNLFFDPDGTVPTTQKTGNWNDPAQPDVWSDGTKFGSWSDKQTAVFEGGEDAVIYLYAPVVASGLIKTGHDEQFTVVSLSKQTLTLQKKAPVEVAANILSLEGGEVAGGPFIKTGEGMLRFGNHESGDLISNTVRGATVKAGELRLQKAPGTVALGGDIYVKGGKITFYSGDQLEISATLRVEGGEVGFGVADQSFGALSVLDTSNINSYEPLTLHLLKTDGPALILGAVQLDANTGIDLAADSAQTVVFETNKPGSARIDGKLIFGGGKKTFIVGDGNEDTDLQILGDISEAKSASLIKEGTGTLELHGALAYTGETAVLAGTLRLKSAAAQISSTLRLSDSATLDLAFDGAIHVAQFITHKRPQANGTWGASDNRSVQYKSAQITGPGVLQVGGPKK